MENLKQQVVRQLGPNLTIGERLGKGAFGEVYAARHRTYSKPLAIKVEWKHPDEPEEVNTLFREAKILQSLREVEGIPSLKEYKSAETLRFMVMDCLGPNIASLLQLSGNKLTLKTTLMLFDQLLSRIEEVHTKGFIHRDIKPENFVVGDEKAQNRVYLIDFGIAKPFRSKNGSF
jgi:serine/threonine protein kinase